LPLQGRSFGLLREFRSICRDQDVLVHGRASPAKTGTTAGAAARRCAPGLYAFLISILRSALTASGFLAAVTFSTPFSNLASTLALLERHEQARIACGSQPVKQKLKPEKTLSHSRAADDGRYSAFG
jgi:hypothetical protein